MATEKDIQDVIKTLIAEGVGEGTEGMRRIAETILNRAEQRGISPAEVVRERAQFTGYSNPGPGAVKAFSDPNALTAAQAAWALAQGPDDPTGGANHYWNPNIVNPSWAGSMTQLGQFGNHAFATDRPIAQPRVAPSPAAQSPMLSASRANTSPSGGNTALQEAVMRAATRERNRVTPQMPPVVSERTIATVPTTRSAFNGDPLAPSSGSVVARIPTSQSAPFNGDPLTPSTGQVVATIPTRSTPAISRAPISYAGQERIVRPAASASDNIASQRAEQRIQRAPPQLPDKAQLNAATGFRVPQAAQFAYDPSPAPDRLAANALPPDPSTVQQLPMVARAPILPPLAPPTQVASQLSVTPSRVAPAPQMRPAPRPPVMVAAQPSAPRAPLRVMVSGSRTAPSPFTRPMVSPVEQARRAVMQSGDTSSGNRLEVAQQQAMAQSWRDAQERKR